MDLLRLYVDLQNYKLSFDVSAWMALPIVVLFLGGLLVRFLFRKSRIVKMNISLGNIGKVEIAPSVEDLQVAHRIWTELVTRKAAIPFDPEHDVIIEVYNSWYALFTKVRELVGNIPADLIRKDKSTQEVIRISTMTLNDGLRPHLTKWQARFRTWYDSNKEQLKNIDPQQLQKKFPAYDELVSDMLTINGQLISYANELKKLIGHTI